MKKIYSTFTAAFIALFCIVGFVCAKPAPWPVAPEYINPVGNEIPMVASYIFYDDSPVTTEFLKDIRRAGFNMFRASMHEPALKNTLSVMKGTDMKMMMYLWEALDTTKTLRMVNKYKRSPYIASYFVKDEPRAHQFQDLKKLNDLFRQADSTKLNYINLLPAVDASDLRSRDYETYVSDYVRTVNPSMISFDCYPIVTPNGKDYVHDMTYETMETISKISKESERPFWAYILITQMPPYPKPKREYIRFQMFLALAYGAQGFNYYTYCLPDFDRKKGRYSNSPIDNNGQRTDVWYMVRDVNQEVQNLKGVFLGAENINVSLTGPKLPKYTKKLKELPSPFKKLSSTGEGLIVSHFKNGSEEYLLLVNRDILNKQKVNYTLSGPTIRVYSDTDKRKVSGNSLTLTPGGYAIFQIK